MGIGNLRERARAPSTAATTSGYARRSTSTPRRSATRRPTRKLSRLRRRLARTTCGRCYAARDIMRLYRDDRAELERLDSRCTAPRTPPRRCSTPTGSVTRFADPADLREAWDAGEIARCRTRPRATGLQRDPRMGELAGRLEPAGRALPRAAAGGARDGALHRRAGARAQWRRVTARPSPQRCVTSATSGCSSAATARRRGTTRCTRPGWAFDIERRYRSGDAGAGLPVRARPAAVLGAIAWVREPAAIHITVSRDAKSLLARCSTG